MTFKNETHFYLKLITSGQKLVFCELKLAFWGQKLAFLLHFEETN